MTRSGFRDRPINVHHIAIAGNRVAVMLSELVSGAPAYRNAVSAFSDRFSRIMEAEASSGSRAR